MVCEVAMRARVPDAPAPAAGDPAPAPPQELELVEDVWRGEAQDLLSQIAQLQEENKQLMTNLSHKDVSFSEEEFQRHEGRRGRRRGGRGRRLFPRPSGGRSRSQSLSDDDARLQSLFSCGRGQGPRGTE